MTLLNSDRLEIGSNVYIAKGAWINALGSVRLEDEVVLGPYVVMSSLRHEFRNGSVRFGGSSAGPIVIGRGSWLAAHVTVAMGVMVGSGVIVAANGAVTSDIPDNVIAGGVPARVIGERVDHEAEFGTAAEIRIGRHHHTRERQKQ